MEYLFVYGLFRDSGKRVLGECTYCGRANINGRIYRVNEFYPGYVTDKKSKVWGDVYLFDPINLPKMDEYEGDEYLRTKVRTSTDIECWVYQYKYDVSNFEEIKGGDWMLR
jgi:gamma-glutamylcyclotransferase (GGCT)/AIG2-like uncharacterized protein YtfP